MADKKPTKIVNVYPTKNSKKILVAIADIMITFILSVFLFEVAGKPIMKATPYYKDNSDLYVYNEQGRTQVLYDNNLLFFDNTGKTEYTWFYRFDMPEGYKSFSKKKPITLPLAEYLCDQGYYDESYLPSRYPPCHRSSSSP